jgi:Fe2+ transport system protein FeoA
MTIFDIRKGEKFRIIKILLNKEVGKRLADMGFVNGVEGIVVRSALMGDPIQVSILGYNVTLRKSEAIGIEVVTAMVTPIF